MSKTGLMVSGDNHQLLRFDEDVNLTAGPTDRDSPTQAFEPSFGGVEIANVEMVWANSPRQHVPGTSLLRFSPDLSLLSETEISPSDTIDYSNTQYTNAMCVSADKTKLYLFMLNIIGDGSFYQIIELSVTTGVILRRFTPANASGHSVPIDSGHSGGTAGYIALSDDGTKCYFQAVDSTDHTTDVVGVLDIASGTDTQMSWSVTTLDAQISALPSPASHYIIQAIAGVVALPGGDLIVLGDFGTFARVKQDGTLVKSYRSEPWGGRLTSSPMSSIGLCVSYKKDAFWVAGEGDPVAMGIRVPPPPFSEISGDYAGIVAKIDLATGTTLGYASLFQIPYQIWPWSKPPVLTLGDPTARVVVRGSR